MSTPSVHSEDVPERSVSAGDLAFKRRRLGAAAGALKIGCSLYSVEPHARQMPVHVHGDEEEIFYALEGSGLSWQGGEACEVSAGDAILHRPRGKPHTFIASREGLELLAFASGTDTSLTWLPRAGVMWAGPRWVPLDAPHPFVAEGDAGALELPEPGERPSNVVSAAAVPQEPLPGAIVKALGAAAGSRKAGLNHVSLPAGGRGAPLHCHSLEEELFFVLKGDGTLTLGESEHPLRAGDVVARPPSNGVPHAVQAGPTGIVYLVYGTRVPGDSVYYPEQGKVALRGLGVTLDVT